MVSRPLALGLRGFQFFCMLIVLALTANQVAMGGTPAIINYDLFTAIFAMLSLIYLTAATLNESFIFHRAIMLGLDAFNLLFIFCAAVATAAILGSHSCSNGDYLKSNKITLGSSKRCRESQASTAFLFFALAAWIASTVFTFLDSRGSVNMRSGRSNPTMSQVSSA
ncbi:putative non-classical export protein Nce102 [Microthyrium microscopicum]|uniref:Putative non-classical export protein Nce102 n=1 Tax=Microthyrium microscopicum TaxID=703497 RepID=A0A6A6UUH1_9PEZI|nr:putative non-classical export protein Nce102 [Microthyrium microscopicum]